ncbi:MAG: 30S ribosomal protein S9 [Candidatus Xenolissoclinum pacificiensis L6]|uniref:30S ribosomal protein S9 n=1 Tax=Candidatus Xenolissoclinum pacificiensis L6 TaxID=1401685 RepID=W2V2F7_9RICK|nr:MAG: 30S ribosomal protein S9 [Candidatus Xenolissoclinum pacificiensis L6]
MLNRVVQEQDFAPAFDRLGRIYSSGSRKESTARVWIKRGNFSFKVNGVSYDAYFKNDSLARMLIYPLRLVKEENHFIIVATVKGGGTSGQAGAILLAVSKALRLFDQSFGSILRSKKLLTRDSRMVERKKYGRKKARKLSQYSKR